MPVISNWKLTLDPHGTPLVLLNIGDKIQDELSFPAKLGLEVVDLTDSEDPFLRPSGNNVVNISWEIWADEATDLLASQNVLNSLITVLKLGRKPLRIEIYGITDRYWQFANAFITEHEPRRRLESPKARAAKVYAATCVGFELYITLTPGLTFSAIPIAFNQITNNFSAL